MAKDNKRQKITLGEYVTPIGTASWPKLVEPTTRFKPEGVYETKLIYDGETAEKIRVALDKMLDDAIAKFKEEYPDKAKRLKRADLPLTPEFDQDGDETGNFVLKVSRYASGTTKAGKQWKAKLKYADAKGKPVSAKGLSIWSGSLIRVFCTVAGYIVAKDNSVGVKLEIDVVQIKKLVSGGSGVDHDVSDIADDDDDSFVAGDDDDISDDDDGDSDDEDGSDF